MVGLLSGLHLSTGAELACHEERRIIMETAAGEPATFAKSKHRRNPLHSFVGLMTI